MTEDTTNASDDSLYEGPDPDAGRLLDMLRSGQKIQAIKLYREKTGCSLKEAKETVEALADQHGIPQTAGCSSRPAAMIGGMAIGVASALYWFMA